MHFSVMSEALCMEHQLYISYGVLISQEAVALNQEVLSIKRSQFLQIQTFLLSCTSLCNCFVFGSKISFTVINFLSYQCS